MQPLLRWEPLRLPMRLRPDMCMQCVSAGASVMPAALTFLGGMVWKHRRDEAREDSRENQAAIASDGGFTAR